MTGVDGDRLRSLREEFLERGFVGPGCHGLGNLDEPGLMGALVDEYRAMAAHVHGDGLHGQLAGDWRFKAHLLSPAFYNLVQHPVVVDAVRAVLGLDAGEALICRSSDFNVKPARSSKFFSWHQDGRYARASPCKEVVTVWIAMTKASEAAGCLRYIPSQLSSTGLLPHKTSAESENMLSLGQTIPEVELLKLTGSDKLVPVSVPLRASEFSVHSFLTPHCSGPNTTDHPRMGFAIRYVTSKVKISGTVKESALLVSGNVPDGYSTFDLQVESMAPEETMGAKEKAAHARAISLETANYFQGEEKSGFL